MRAASSAVVLGLLALAAGDARADEPRKQWVIRLATAAPDGSEWAKSFRAMNRELEVATQGRLKVKIIYGGIAGNEVEVMNRIERGQLDGALSGGMMCERVMPSMKVLRIPGLFQSRAESFFVTHELDETLAAEAREAGYRLMGTSGVGSDVIYSRKPLRTMEAITKTRLWAWDLDLTATAIKKEMGWQTVETPVEDAARAFDDGKVDGFVAIPSAALVFQWYTQAKYMTDLRAGYLTGCFLVAERGLDVLPAELQRALKLAVNGLVLRFENLNQRLDKKLLGGVFQKSGIEMVHVSETVRAEFFASARAARERLTGTLIPRELMDRTMKLLADYRAEHEGD